MRDEYRDLCYVVGNIDISDKTLEDKYVMTKRLLMASLNLTKNLLGEREKVTKNGKLLKENERLRETIVSMVLDRHGPPPKYEDVADQQ